LGWVRQEELLGGDIFNKECNFSVADIISR
jgi:hypothetical protein